jgi:hypothetical protein
LFIGNNLAAGKIKTSDGTTIDLRNIRSPIVVFCSKGDNITPPQQALGWILDLYDDVDQIRSYAQTIVYTIHETIGHLGIFVSTGVARKEHGEFASNIDLIDLLPPGLYEAVFKPKTSDIAGQELVVGEWVMRCEARTLDDIRALGGNDAADERRFETAARVSRTNLALYQTFVQPWIRNLTNVPVADFMQRVHPLRLQYEMFSDANPWMRLVDALAAQIRRQRRPASADNPMVAWQESVSEHIVTAFDNWRDLNETLAERLFLLVYGSPLLQAAVGVDPKEDCSFRRAGQTLLHHQLMEARITELKSRITKGGSREGLVRTLLYIGMPRGAVDERGFEAIRRVRVIEDGTRRLSLSEFKATVREQFFMLLIDPQGAVEAIPGLLPGDVATRRKAFATLREVLSAQGEVSGEVAARLAQMAKVYEAASETEMVSVTRLTGSNRRLAGKKTS